MRGTNRRTTSSSTRTPRDATSRKGNGDELHARIDRLLAEAESIRLRDPVTALRIATEAHMLARGSGYNSGLAAALRVQGMCDVAAGYHDRARDLLAESATLCDAAVRTRDDHGAAESFLGLGTLFVLQENANDGLEVLEQAIRRSHRGENRGVEGEALVLQGECYALRGDGEKAMDFLKKGMEMLDRLGDPVRLASATVSAARTRRKLGAYSRAMILVRRGRQRAESHGLEVLVRQFQVIAASIRMEIGDETRAMTEFTEAACAAESYGAHQVIIDAALGISMIYRRAGNQAAAIEWANRRLEHARTVGSIYHQAATLNTLGNIHFRLGDYPAATSAYMEALAFATEIGRHDIEEICLENLGNVYRDSGRRQEAIESYGRSRRLASSRKNRATTASCYYNLGLLDLDHSDYTAAIQHLNTAAIAAEAAGDRALLADAHHELARAYEGRNESGDLRKAYDHYKLHHECRTEASNQRYERLRKTMELRAEIDRAEFEFELENRPAIGGGPQAAYADMPTGDHEIPQDSNSVVNARDASPHAMPTSTMNPSDSSTESSAADGSNVDRNVEVLRREVELREREGAFIEEISRRHPTISPGELRVLLFMRAGMKTPDMSAFLGVSDRAVEKHRYKIRRKLALPTHVNLADYVRSIGM